MEASYKLVYKKVIYALKIIRCARLEFTRIEIRSADNATTSLLSLDKQNSLWTHTHYRIVKLHTYKPLLPFERISRISYIQILGIPFSVQNINILKLLSLILL